MIAKLEPVATENGTQFLILVNGSVVYETKTGLMSEAICWCLEKGVRVLT